MSRGWVILYGVLVGVALPATGGGGGSDPDDPGSGGGGGEETPPADTPSTVGGLGVQTPLDPTLCNLPVALCAP